MTPEEIDEMERMWASGMSFKEMERRMGYATRTMADVMKAKRHRFPKRLPLLTDEEWSPWLKRIESGELTQTQVCAELGVCKETVRKRMRAAGIEPRRRYGQKGDS